MSQPLFRHDALDSSRDKLHGSPVIARSPTRFAFTVLAAAIAIAGTAFAFWGEYTRKARVPGFLAPDRGLIKVISPAAGTLVEHHVHEGQRVCRGERLFLLTTERGSLESAAPRSAAIARIEERHASLERERTKQAEIDAIAHRAAKERSRGLRAELAQLDTEIQIQQERTATARRTLERHHELLKRDLVAMAKVERQRELWLEQTAREQSLRRTRVGLRNQRAALAREAAAKELEAENRRSATTRDLAELGQELVEHQARRTIVIEAPADGIVTAILIEKGQMARVGATLLSILPEGAVLEAQLMVPSRAIGFIQPSQRVSLRYKAFPYQRFGLYRGRVSEISRTLILPSEARLPTATREPAYRVTVALAEQAVAAYAKEFPLQAGMQLEADVWLGRRTLVEWLFEPLIGLAKRG